MGLFTKRQPDQSWRSDIQPSYEAALTVITDLDQALDDNSLEGQFIAVQRVLNQLPRIATAVKQVPEPTSREARQAHKALKSALRTYVDGAKAGATYFKDMSGGPGQRVVNETGMARRAAAGRLVFNQSFFLRIVKSGREKMEQCKSMIQQADHERN